MNRMEDAWDAWLHTEENEAAADLAAGQAAGGPAHAEDDDSSGAHHAHHEADQYAGQHETGSADQAADIDNMGYTTTEEMMTDNMTAEDLPVY